MSNISANLLSLRLEGYFIQHTQENDVLSVTVTMYLVDYDDETGVTSYLQVDPLEPERHENGCCAACKSAGHHPLETVRRGMVICPLCNEWAPPWYFRERVYKGEFQLSTGRQIGNSLPPDMAAMITEKLRA